MNASVGLKSPIDMLEDLRANVYHVNSISNDDSAKFDLELIRKSVTLYKLSGDYKETKLSVKVVTPIRSYEKLEFLGDVVKVSEGVFRFDGDLTSPRFPEPLKLSGEVRTNGESISSVRASIAPAKNSPSSKKVDLYFDRKSDGFKLWTENGPRDISLDYSYENLLNWSIDAKIDAEGKVDFDYKLNAFVNAQKNGNLSASVQGRSPFKSIEKFKLGGNMLLTEFTGIIKTYHRLNQDSSDFEFEWGLKFMENMMGRIVLGYDIDEAEKHIDAQLFFKNPRQSYRNLNIGFDVNIDHEAWRFGSNATVGYLSQNNLDAIVSLTLPPPEKDSHTILISYHGQEESGDFNYAVGYRTQESQLNYASDGSVSIFLMFLLLNQR